MPQVIVDEEIFSRSWVAWVRTIAFGVAVGIVFWLLTLLLDRYVIEPLACRQVANAGICLTSDALSGNIAALLAGALAVLGLVRWGVVRPIIIAVATIALLWDLASWTAGLPAWEVMLWSAGLYGVSYGLFAWIARYASLWVGVVISILVVLIIRISVLL